MEAPYDPNKYDPNVVIQAADDRLSGNDLEGGQMVFQSALLSWVDDAREGAAGDAEHMREAVATLWLAYAHFLAKAKQFKSATEAYEQAVSCPVAGSVGRIWLDYARFAEDRDKLRTAQDAYIRALVGKNGQPPAVHDEQDRSLLWNEFLEMMRKTTPELTLDDLQIAVKAEAAAEGSGSAALPESVLSGEAPDSEDLFAQSPPPKRMRVDDPAAARSPYTPSSTQEESKTHVVTGESVEVEAAAFADIIQQKSLPPEVAGAWMIRDGNTTAQPPPQLFGPAPPKLSDPTGKELLGDLALPIIERLLGASGSLLLDICRGLWTMTALKEKEAKVAIAMLDKTMATESERLEANLEARLSVAGAAFGAVQQMNNSERQAFQNTCSQQRQSLLSGIAWEFRQLLCVQQQVLTKLAVPGFEGPTVDASALQLQSTICSFLHSAFYLRTRIGDKPHEGMLKSQAERLRRDRGPASPFTNNNSLLQGNYNMQSQPQPQSQHQNQPQHQQHSMMGMQQGYSYPGQPPMQGHMMQNQQHPNYSVPQYPYYQ
jgi:tetratricopeptide (TPR) repeat protein